MTNISSSLLAAYHATHYQVYLPVGLLTLRIAEFSPRLEQLHTSNNVNCSAFITAWNPYSNDSPLQVNQAAQAELEQDLGELGIPFIKGQGIDPASGRPGEESMLALGLDRELAIQLGRKYRQNAIVWSGSSATPELILLK